MVLSEEILLSGYLLFGEMRLEEMRTGWRDGSLVVMAYHDKSPVYMDRGWQGRSEIDFDECIVHE